MPKWNLIIDVAKCEECNNCFLSCMDEYDDNDFLPYSVAQPRHGQRWVDIQVKERGQFPVIDTANLPVSCMHCDNAPCMRNVKDGAVYKTADGIVIIDPVKAKGQKDIVKTCPYGAIWWNEDKQVAQKCTWCAHLLDKGWKEPRCVDSCPTGALKFGEEEEFKDLIAKAEILKPEAKAGPRVYYIGIPKRFVAGAVYDPEADECLENL